MNGYYTKHFKTIENTEETFLSFDATTESEDTHFSAHEILKTTNMQVVEQRKELGKFYEILTKDDIIIDINRYFNHVLYSFYNWNGQRVKSKIIHFDFENETVTINDKKLKVEKDYNFIYKFMKTKIKASGGIKGLYKFIVEAMHVDSPFNSSFYSILEKII